MPLLVEPVLVLLPTPPVQKTVEVVAVPLARVLSVQADSV